MGRKKNIQPKRRFDTNGGDDNGHKRPKLPTYYFPDRRSTNVIPAAVDHPLLATFPTFVVQLQKRLPQMIKEYKEALIQGKTGINGWYNGFRLINGNRIEIKVLSEWLTQEFGHVDCWNPVQLIEYAQAQAQKDERIINNILQNHGEVQFSEWSIIVSSTCQAQSIHIDVPANNYQFGLVLQDGIPGTMVMSKHGSSPETPEELCSTLWMDAPQKLKDCVLNNLTVKDRMQQLLHAYGPLLIPRAELEASMVGGDKPLLIPPQSTTEASETRPTGSGLKCGELICMAGGIPHAGPASEEFRAVVFAAASPTKESLYNVDEQYFAHSALLFAIQIVWDDLEGPSENGDWESKRWLLRKLAKTVQDFEQAPIENHHYVSKAFTTLMHQIAKVSQGDLELETAGCGQTKTNLSINHSLITIERIEQIISDFLQENATKSEQSLFQYRSITIWQATGGPG